MSIRTLTNVVINPDLDAPETMTQYATREEWLTAAVKALKPTLEARTGMMVPKVRVSCGWPHAAPGKGVGWCYASKASEDHASNIFVSPTVTDARTVLAILAHEMIHAADDCKSSHGGAFRVAHKAVGFVDKPTACTPGPEFKAELTEMAKTLGRYPHKAIVPTENEKKQTTRLIKVTCPGEQSGFEDDRECGYTVRTTMKWINELGCPICPCGSTMVADLPAGPEGEDT